MSARRPLARLLSDANATSVSDLLAHHPKRTYAELAELLAPEVLPIELLDAHLREAHALGPDAYRAAAAEALARQLRAHLPQGWDAVDESENLAAWVTWTSALAQIGRPEEAIRSLWAFLAQHATPGWLPDSGDDPLLRRAFAECWGDDTR